MAICMKKMYLVANDESVFVRLGVWKGINSSVADVVFYATLVINSQ